MRSLTYRKWNKSDFFSVFQLAFQSLAGDKLSFLHQLTILSSSIAPTNDVTWKFPMRGFSKENCHTVVVYYHDSGARVKIINYNTYTLEK